MPQVLLVTNMFPTEERPVDGIFVKETADLLRIRGVDLDILFLRGSRTPLKYLLGLFKLWERLLRKRYDLVHAFYGYSGVVAVMQSKCPVVLTLCGSDVNLASQRWLSKIASKRAVRTIVQSRQMKERLGAIEAVVMPFGVNLELFRPTDYVSAKAHLGMETEALHALFPYDPARKGKRYALFEEAVAVVSKSEPRLRPITLGAYSRGLVPVYMSAADVLVITSETEGSPNTVKEALACGLPIVSVDVGDVRVLIQGVDGCWVCDDAPEALAEGILKALRFGRTQGRKRAVELSSDAVAAKLVGLYGEVLHASGEPVSKAGGGRRLC